MTLLFKIISTDWDLFQMGQKTRPCSEVEKGSNVTLTCSSEANPPVQRYAWFLINGSVHHKLTSHFELYFGDVQSYSSGQYYCVVDNKHGSQNSSIVTLEVKDIHGTFCKLSFHIQKN